MSGAKQWNSSLVASSSSHPQSVRAIRIDGLVVLKIIKHIQENDVNVAGLVAGSLLGMDVGDVMEVTHRCVCFGALRGEGRMEPLGIPPASAPSPYAPKLPAHSLLCLLLRRPRPPPLAFLLLHSFPQVETVAAESDKGSSAVSYEREMEKALHEVNVDNNMVGWYQGSYLDSFVALGTIDWQFRYQEKIPKRFVLPGGPSLTSFEGSSAVAPASFESSRSACGLHNRGRQRVLVPASRFQRSVKASEINVLKMG